MKKLVISEKKELDFDVIEEEEDNYWDNATKNPYALPEFDLEKLYSYRTHVRESTLGLKVWAPSMAVFGMSGAGKTNMVKVLLDGAKQRGLIGRVAVITGTKVSKQWEGLVPEATIFDVEEGIAAIDDILRYQEKQLDDAENGKPLDMNTFQYTIILDDFIGDSKEFNARYSGALDRLYTSGRHFGINIVLLTQWPTAVSTTIRGNTKWVIMSRQNGFNARRHLADDHLSFLHRTKQAMPLLSRACRNYQALVVDNTFEGESDTGRVYRLKTILASDLPLRPLCDDQWYMKMQRQYSKRTHKRHGTSGLDMRALDDIMDMFIEGGLVTF